ncbi:MAG: hypothetical protein QM737_21695 [Ferruginibacter sp.]
MLPGISLPLLKNTGDLSIYNNSALLSISLPALQHLTSPSTNSWGTSITNNANLTSISFDQLLTVSNDKVSFGVNKLPSAQVNYLLHKLVTSMPIPTVYIKTMQSVAAPPTGQGITDKATLVGAGITVDTD